jgi:hypothetical protein
MRARRCLTFTLLTWILIPSAAFGHDLTGKWVGKTSDEHDLTLSLKSEGAQVSGSLLGADGRTEYPLQDVQSDGDNLAFSVEVQFQGNPLRLVAKGKTSVDQIQLHVETEDASWSSDATLSREPAKAP